MIKKSTVLHILSIQSTAALPQSLNCLSQNWTPQLRNILASRAGEIFPFSGTAAGNRSFKNKGK